MAVKKDKFAGYYSLNNSSFVEVFPGIPRPRWRNIRLIAKNTTTGMWRVYYHLESVDFLRDFYTKITEKEFMEKTEGFGEM